MLLLTGCTTPLVRSVKYSSHDAMRDSGVLYYLPNRLVKASVDVKQPSVAQLEKKRDAALRVIVETENQLAEYDKELAKPNIEKMADTNNAEIAATVAGLIEKKEMMGKLNERKKKEVDELSVRMSQEGTSTVDITFELLPASPDLSHGYVLVDRHSWFRSDESTFCTSPSGLLESGAFTSEDKTVEIVAKLAEAAARLVSTATRALVRQNQQAGGDVATLPKHAEVVFDPASPADCKRVLDLINKYTGLSFEVIPEVARRAMFATRKQESLQRMQSTASYTGARSPIALL